MIERREWFKMGSEIGRFSIVDRANIDPLIVAVPMTHDYNNTPRGLWGCNHIQPIAGVDMRVLRQVNANPIA